MINTKNLLTYSIICLAGFGLWTSFNKPQTLKNATNRIHKENILHTISIARQAQENNATGNYLSSQFAQRRQQWNEAGKFLNALKKAHPDTANITKQLMVLAINDANMDKATAAAQKLLTAPKQDDVSRTMAALVIITDNLIKEDIAHAKNNIQTIPQSQLSTFIKPILTGWLSAANGQYTIQSLQGDLFYAMHALYIADYLGQTNNVAHLLQEILKLPNLNASEIERLADIYLHNNNPAQAIKIYEQLLALSPQADRIKNKRDAAQKWQADPSTPKPAYFTTMTSPAQGLAQAYYDMAYILYRDQGNESARIFATLALAANPNLSQAHILLASMATRNNLYDPAIAHYKAIKPDTPYYREARREAAHAYENAGMPERAITMLQNLYNSKNDIQALIQIGDIYRRQDNFKDAVKTYNQVETILGAPLPSQYWYVLYTRGMSYERAGNWEQAEQDLSAALAYQPGHPYILNYLGYAWVDKGININKAMSMIEQALAIQPNDGYITDSLGWVHFKRGNYQKAVSYLEKAVELVPADPVINDHLGDAYWQTGRKIEARYQWQRALRFTETEDEKATLENKIQNGLTPTPPIKSATNGHNDSDG